VSRRRSVNAIGPGTWANWAQLQFKAIHRQERQRPGTFSPRRGVVRDIMSTDARRPRLVKLSEASDASSSTSVPNTSEATTSSTPTPRPRQIITARDVLLNGVGWSPGTDELISLPLSRPEPEQNRSWWRRSLALVWS
jgi:hypothetical protein